jgi:hypothetical protein
MFAHQQPWRSKTQIDESVPVFSKAAPSFPPRGLTTASRASALATGCSVEISGMGLPVHDLRQNRALGSPLHPFDYFCNRSLRGHLLLGE